MLSAVMLSVVAPAVPLKIFVRILFFVKKLNQKQNDSVTFGQKQFDRQTFGRHMHHEKRTFDQMNGRAGNTKGGSITVPLTSCLTCLD